MNIEANDKSFTAMNQIITAANESPIHHSIESTTMEGEQGNNSNSLHLSKDSHAICKDKSHKANGSKTPYIPQKKYSVIDKERRESFIQRVLSKQVSIKEAAEEYGIKFSTSKAILQTFRREGRIGKKKTRERRRKLFSNEISAELVKKYKLYQPQEVESASSTLLNSPSKVSSEEKPAQPSDLSTQALIAKLVQLPKQQLEQVNGLMPSIQQLNSYLKAAELLQAVIRIQQEEIQRTIVNYAQTKVVPPPTFTPKPVQPQYIAPPPTLMPPQFFMPLTSFNRTPFMPFKP